MKAPGLLASIAALEARLGLLEGWRVAAEAASSGGFELVGGASPQVASAVAAASLSVGRIQVAEDIGLWALAETVFG